MGMKLFEFDVYFGRQGSLQGRFVLDEDEQADLEKLYGKRIYFVEVLGKYSDIEHVLQREDITMVTDNNEFLSMALDLSVSLDTGINPLAFYLDMVQDGAADPL